MTDGELDDVILAALRGGRGAEERLAAAGAPALQRLLDVWYGRPTRPLALPPELAGRAAVDALAGALAVVARACPGLYVDAVADRPPTTHVLAILGPLDDPRVDGLLVRALDEQDWLLRCNAARALGLRRSAVADAGLDRAAADPEPVVRAAASEAIGRRRPEHALALIGALLDDPATSGPLRRSLLATRAALRRA